MSELMKKYNALLDRWEKAEQYFSREDISIEDKQKQLPNVVKLHDEINVIVEKIKQLKEDMAK